MPLYAVLRPSPRARTNVGVSMVSRLSRARANPRQIWERMTPEFPLAPIKAPCATACAMRPTLCSPELDISLSVSYTHLRAHETRHDLVCRLLLEKKKN